MTDEYDVIIIGGGAAGENVAGRTSPGGLSTVIIESHLVGGECTYWACMPSKALLRPQEVLAAARRVPAAAGAVTGTIDAEKALSSRDAFANRWDDYWQVKWVELVEADLIRGSARLTGDRTVHVDLAEGGTRELTARKAVVVATGSVPAFPPIDGIEDVGAWTSRDIVTAKKVPGSLIVLGSGPVGAEMAQAWKSLGCNDVTVIERRTADESTAIEPFAKRLLVEALEEDGIVVRMGCNVVAARRDGDRVTVTLDDAEELSAERLVVATGRRPNTASVGLESVGLTPSERIDVADTMQATGVPAGWLYAVGDVNGRALLTHQGKYQARQAGDHILGKGTTAWADNVAVPAVIFTDPQIGYVGLNEGQAREKGLNVKTVELGLGVAAASLMGKEVKGGVKFVVDTDRNVLVGATFVGPGAGEQVHAATIAIVAEVSLDKLWHAVPSFPTLSELWLRFLEAYGY
jgi:pyruvate/2-oxoglutarate dehydrogenase complex dihydrolipoamide dehydrogenase (E3) component